MERIRQVSRNRVDSDRVRRAFSRQAREYDAYARVQKRVARGLLDRLAAIADVGGPVLDIGCGTGELARQFARTRPELGLTLCDIAHGMTRHAASSLPEAMAVDARAEALPFRKGCFGLILSSSVYQWVDDLSDAFGESARLLAPGGLFAFALFGSGTLHELRDSYRRAAGELGLERGGHLQEFHGRGEVASALAEAGLETVSLETADEVERHGDVQELLRHLKKIGAGNAARNRPQGLAPRKLMSHMSSLYRQTYGEGRSIPATYEVIYAIARKASSGSL